MLSGAVARSSAAYGQGSGSVLQTTLQCIGNETALINCSGASFLTNPPCQHSRDAGVMCQRKQCNKMHDDVCTLAWLQLFAIFVAFPSNIRVSTRSNTSIDVSWSMPNEFYSDIIKYR